MSPTSSRPQPVPRQGPRTHPERLLPRDGAHDEDHLLESDWTEHLERMDPDDLRLLAMSLPLIEQAKGILMGHYGCDAVTAFTILRRWSSGHQLRLRDLAAALVAEASRGGARGDGQPSDAVARFLRTQGLG